MAEISVNDRARIMNVMNICASMHRKESPMMSLPYVIDTVTSLPNDVIVCCMFCDSFHFSEYSM